jgi:UDP-hydrolysing UDP-N-acetyl-D-glucosamine 2-epimerase
MKKICVFVGSRANYSSCKSIMRAVQKHSDLELQVALGASAVLDRFGNIEDIVKKDGFEISAKFYMIVEGENPITMAKSTGLGIIELSMIFNSLKPDIVLVVGDRFDVMAPTIAASYMNIPIAHTMGGEVSGTIDESVRHAITKMAHIHFPSNEEARQRIINLGENPMMVFNVGCPRMDLVVEIINSHRNGDRIDQGKFFAKYKGVGPSFDLEKERFLVVAQHPVTTEYGQNRRQVETALCALDELRMPTIMIWPNVDAGSEEISKAIRTFRERRHPDWLHLFINLPIDIYIKLMDMCACLVGNSSSAIREGSFIGVPAVNIGSRQKGRARGKNVVDVSPSKEEIKEAILRQVKNGRYDPEYIYGNGHAGQAIADILSSVKELRPQKQIYY